MSRLLLLTLAGSGLGLALMLLRRVLRHRLPAAFYYGAWLVVLVRLILPLPGLIPAGAQTQSAPAVVFTERAEDAGHRAYRYAGEGYDDAVWSETVPDGDVETAPEAGQPLPEAEALPAGDSSHEGERPDTLRSGAKALVRSERFWLAVWLIGAVIALGRTVNAYWQFYRAIQPTLIAVDDETARVYALFDLRRRPELLRSPFVKTPMLLGLVRPCILLPGKLPPKTAENVLRHELTHYKRGDLCYKWFSALVFSLHWFNPLMLPFRREIDRVCELSCDERVLRDMDKGQQHSYGETLLDLAAGHALPVGVVATTFSTEKRDLKERLEHIMKYRHRSRAAVALAMAALILLTGCAAALAPAAQARSVQTENLSADYIPNEIQRTPAPAEGLSGEEGQTTVSAEPAAPLGDVTVSTVDELLAAICPSTTVHLMPGEYDLSEASDYGQTRAGGTYAWEKAANGYELVIEGVSLFSIVYDGDPGEAVISAEPRYADVLTFRECADVTLSGFTAGHTEAPGICTGGVIALEGTDNVRIDGCVLYGCGIRGITAENCRHVRAERTVIKECSDGAVLCTSCYDVQLDGCEIRDCGGGYSTAWRLFSFQNCYAAALLNCDIHDNQIGTLLSADYTEGADMLGCRVYDNSISGGAIDVTRFDAVVYGCEFENNGYIRVNTGDGAAVRDMSGAVLGDTSLADMALVPCEGYEAPALPEGPALERQQREGYTYVEVSDVDGLLAAIAPDTVVHLLPGRYDLSAASHYGAYGSAYYYWQNTIEGPGLIIAGVDNLTIEGAGREDTEIIARPHSADVLTFEGCGNITVSGIEAGHADGASGCGGVVLRFAESNILRVRDCGLYGCGRLGIWASNSSEMTVSGTEIYECSAGGAYLERCTACSFDGCVFRENGGQNLTLNCCSMIRVDGEDVSLGAGTDGVAIEPWMFNELFLSDRPQPPFDIAFYIAAGEPERVNVASGPIESLGLVWMKVGQVLKLGVNVPAEYLLPGTEVVFQHYDEGFVRLDADGVITALAPGDDSILAGVVDADGNILCAGMVSIHVVQ